MVENRAQTLKDFHDEEDTKSGTKETKAQENKDTTAVTGKKKIPTPAVQAIPAGYKEDDRIVKEIKRDGLPLTADNKELYKELDEEIRGQNPPNGVESNPSVPLADARKDDTVAM